MIPLDNDSSVELAREKAKLRKQYLMRRKSIGTAQKSRLDRGLFQTIRSAQAFVACDLLLTYVSVNDEADTKEIIRYAIQCGKTVAVPRCVPGKNEIEFFTISSLDDLRRGSYGLLEPEPDDKCKLDKTSAGLCLLPGLSFDLYGNRLGYGGGYYDRFLHGFNGTPVGLCYTEFIHAERIPSDKNDQKVKCIITENKMIEIKDSKSSF